MLSGSESSALSEHTLSPFSDESQRSEPTSDETPDLGAFTTVFHTLSNLHPVVRPRIHVPSARAAHQLLSGWDPHTTGSSQPDSILSLPPSSASLPVDSSFPSTARPDEYYFSISDDYVQDDDDSNDDPDDDSLSTSSSSPFSTVLQNGSSSDDVHLFHLESDDGGLFELGKDSSDGPSLGQLDEALSFLAAERAKWSADRSRSDLPNHITTSPPSKKKRRRKRLPAKPSNRTPRASLTDAEDDLLGGRSSSASSHPPDAADEPPSSPSLQLRPPTTHLSRREKRRLKQLASGTSLTVIDASLVNATASHSQSTNKKGKAKRTLHLSRSTPQLRTTASQLAGTDSDPSETFPTHPNPEPCSLMTRNGSTALLSGKCGRELGLALPSAALLVNDLDTEVDGPSTSTREFIDIRGPSPKSSSSFLLKRPGQQTGGRGKGKQKDRSTKEKDDSPPERLIHVFIDHSNILIGLLSWLKRHPKKFANLPLPPRPAANLHQRSQSYTTQNPFPHLQHYHSTPNTHSTGKTLTGHVPSNPSSSSTGTSSFTLDVSPGSTSEHPAFPNPHQRPLKPTNHLSHAALALILERGRPVTRRVMVTSSPLYQPMEGAERLGYEVRVFMRVPDFGDGMDRERSAAKAARHSRSVSLGAAGPALPTVQPTSPTTDITGSFPSTLRDPQWTSLSNSGLPASNGQPLKHRRHQRQKGSTSNESDPPQQTGFPEGPISPISGMPMTPQKIKYREQGVDELLQLKLHQAIASADELPYPLPPGSTIVLATGDGNVGQFNEDGFLGSVRTALRRGWEVELYAWEVGLSKRWAKEFSLGKKGGEYEGRFRVIGLEQFGEHLVERSWW
ncbi:hypothetical protein DL96DRAFT_1603000 [Flagelloscypha sp. PMI_526]|nr:hypothetical protein DL96DRAFT_1603000 [Flagelloscypha sp. PMI_526]